MATEHLRAVGARYVVDDTLGHGGMGAVYRARDIVSGENVALKRLVVPEKRKAERYIALFEREYHTLAQLAHPSVIQVYDYGVDDAGPFYTMELLAGEDLHECRELPFREICGALYDVASCLSLLHARRLVHRDVTARNIRIVSPGRAKLIDFGALAPMGPCKNVVCTPVYMPPEALLMQSIDGRADLFALGVALYRALTGTFPYLGRSIRGMRTAWRQAPTPPHELVADVPRALSQLAMSLVALDRDARPRDASQVMARLASIGELDREEPAAISGAYLFTPNLVGRADALRRARELSIDAMRGRGGALLFTGPPGVGRSRMLDAAALEARVLGATVVRVSGQEGVGEFALMQPLLEQLGALLPQEVAQACEAFQAQGISLFGAPSGGEPSATDAGAAGSAAEQSERVRLGEAVELKHLEGERPAVIAMLRALLESVASKRPLVLVADDLQTADEASLAVLSGLFAGGRRGHMLLIGSMLNLQDGSGADRAKALLAERCECHPLLPLDRASMRSLVQSVFGAAHHAEVVSERLYAISRGFPRDALALAEYLVSSGVISYRGGSFSLPATLAADALPESLSAALAKRAQELSTEALTLAQAHALSGRRAITLDACRRLTPAIGDNALHAALDELVAADVFGDEGSGYVLRHDAWAAALCEGMDAAQREGRHLALAGMLELGGADSLARAYHLMHGGDLDRAIQIVGDFARNWDGEALEVFSRTNLRPDEVGWLFERVVALLEQRESADKHLLAACRYFTLSAGLYVDARWFYKGAATVEAYLKRDSGHTIYHSLDPSMEPMARLLEALKRAQEDYDADPKAHHYPPAEAIRHLVLFAAASIAVGSKTVDDTLRRRLPELLRPFAPLTPVVDCVTRNCEATAKLVEWDFEGAIERFQGVLDTISALQDSNFEGADEIRTAVVYGLGVYNAALGAREEAGKWLDMVADHPRQASNVLRVRGQLALQWGDLEGAQGYREAAEQHDVESEHKQIFGRTGLTLELAILGVLGDLSLFKQCLSTIEPLAEHFIGWRSYALHARAQCDRLCGDLDAALVGFDACQAASPAPAPGLYPEGAWYITEVAALEVLLALERLDECRERARRALAVGDGCARGTRFDGIQRTLALCEAKLGEPSSARKRLDELVAVRQAIGTTGVWLGVLHETRALVELADGQLVAAREAFERTRVEYLRCSASGLAVRLESLRQQLLEAGVQVEGFDGVAVLAAQSRIRSLPAPAEAVSQALGQCRDSAARAQHGLSLLCDEAGAIDGHLFLLQGRHLGLVGSLGEELPPDGLREFAQAQMDIEVAEEPTMTVALTRMTEPDAALAGFRVAARDGALAREYVAIGVRATLGAQSSLIGIAALGLEHTTRAWPEVTALANALGDYLLRVGDSTLTADHSTVLTQDPK